MIISASRRTDIPALYGPWLAARLREGRAQARNPFSPRSAREIDLTPAAVDGIVLWTKNPVPFLPLLPALNPYAYYFNYTLNPYGPPLEPGLPGIHNRLEAFRELSARLGRDRVVWRYDPVILSPRTPAEYHLEQFDLLSGELAPWTDKCVMSFMDRYSKIERAIKEYAIRQGNEEEMRVIAAGFAAIAGRRGLTVESCCEPALDPGTGVRPGRCVDAALLGRIAGRELNAPRDGGQRPGCGCARSADIGAYDTCVLGCVYCYANAGAARARRNFGRHDPDSPTLTS